MFNYENVMFKGKLPEENFGAGFTFCELQRIKNKIDIKLLALESKLKTGDFLSRIKNEETEAKHLRAAVHFTRTVHIF